MSNDFKSFLGTGWSFPPTFSRQRGAHLSSGVEDIEESIRIILSTMPGERTMHPEFGCNLRTLVFEKLNTSFIAAVEDIIRTALLHFEPRVKMTGATVLERDDVDGQISINIEYTVIATNTRHNLVYPFYLMEATSASAYLETI